MAAARVHLLSASAIKPLRSSQGITFTNAFPNLIATPKPLRSRESTSSVNSPPPMTLMFSIGILSLVYALLSTRSQFLAIAYCTAQSVLEVLRRKRLHDLKQLGLLHDVGHGPFSHMFEGKFLSRVFNGDKWSYKKMSVKMIDYMVDEHNIDIDPELLKKVKVRP
ncbi:Deoxynucleoside triphosphate triphosphohydrolase [Arachis hypogaea]|uniref:Deoxynucleoside triphosphate triphosphohydrolase n=1 Tax=Arachis hypogaea TaxID=3818 RepID=A0A6B9V6R7_ARAHY|nr:Deoxynucleoside triphosphate triphosphohydrolase [Arachis hypogaea]